MNDWVSAMRQMRKAVETEEIALDGTEEADWIAVVTELMKPQEQMVEKRRQKVLECIKERVSMSRSSCSTGTS